MNEQEQLLKLTVGQLKLELTKYGKNTELYNTPKQILVDFLSHIQDEETKNKLCKNNSKKRSLDGINDDTSPSKRYQIDDAENNNSCTIEIQSDNSNNILIDQNETIEDIELKLMLNYSYKPILESFLKGNEKNINFNKFNGILGYRLIKEYNRFLCLKIKEKDFESTKLFAPDLIYRFWSYHKETSTKYNEFCKLIGHRILCHQNTKEDNMKRYLYTIQIYETYFGKIDKEFWDNDFNEKNNNSNGNYISDNNDSEIKKIALQFINQYGEKEYHSIEINSPLDQIMKKYASNKGFSLGLVQYLYNGHIITNNTKPIDLCMKNNDIIQILPQKSRNSSGKEKKH